MHRPTPSILISSAALVVALGGTGYAAAQITGQDIKNDTVKSADIRDGSLKPKDFRSGRLPAGEQGPQGIPGTDGADGIGRWAMVDRDGVIVAQSGGFVVRSAYDLVNNTGVPVPAGALGNVYIDANEPLDDNGIVVSIALQNTLDQNNDAIVNGRAPGADGNPEFSGEITATMCGIAGVVGCAPTGANTVNTFVVSPRMSDGSLTQTGDGTPANPNTHKRFYVIITGDSSDYVPVA